MGKWFPNTASLQLTRLLVHRPRQPRPQSTRSQSRIQHILLPQRSGPCWGLTCGKETRRGRRIWKCWRDHLSTILWKMGPMDHVFLWVQTHLQTTVRRPGSGCSNKRSQLEYVLSLGFPILHYYTNHLWQLSFRRRRTPWQEHHLPGLHLVNRACHSRSTLFAQWPPAPRLGHHPLRLSSQSAALMPHVAQIKEAKGGQCYFSWALYGAMCTATLWRC